MSLSTLPRLLRALTAEPLAIDRRTLDAFIGVLRRRMIDGASFNGPELHSELNVAMPRPPRRAEGQHTIQVIPIVGVIENRPHSMGASALQTGERIDAAVADARVDAIVLDIDSPGGTVTGVPEVAEKIMRAREVKPIVAVANGLMASAAYWIGSAAHEVVASPSSEVGSIGVYALHEDWTQALENEGVVITEFSAGRYKTEGAPWKPLNAEAAARFEQRVREVYDWFVRDVARFRGVSQNAVRTGFGEGRVLSAEEAVAAGLADRVETLDSVIARLVAGETPRRARGRRADADPDLDLELERRKRARLRGA